MLELKGITKRYSRREAPAVDRVSLQVNPAEVVGLVGLNGAGKTTSLRIACGVSLASSGDVEVDGISLLYRKSQASRLIGWVPEQPIHDPTSKVDSLVRYYSDIAGGVPRSVGDQLLREWGLDAYLTRRFRELSLGYKRRLAVVVASLTRPKYFLLDEPFNGLDPAAMVQFRKWILNAREEGHGVLLASHVLREVQTLCDRVIVVHRGRIVASITKAEIAPSDQMEVTVILDRMDAGAKTLLERFGAVTLSGSVAVIRGARIDSGAVNTSLIENGYVVKSLTTGEGDLEEFFLRLVGEAR